MRALEMSQPGDATVLGFVDLAIPTAGDGQVLIRVSYAGLNFTDVLARRGAPGYASAWPFVPGMEVAGTVAAIGPGVDEIQVGQQVVAFTPDGGGFAEYVVADARLTARVPAGLDLATATATPLTWATALGLARRAHVAPGDRILVTSAGGGVAAALAAVLDTAAPGVVVGGIGSVAKQDQLSARYVPILRDKDFYEHATAAAGAAFDVILDSVGGDLLDQAPAHLAIGGRLISYGGAAGQPDPATPAYAALRAGNQTLSGFSILRLARTAPEKVTALIGDILLLAHDGLPITAPEVTDWDGLIAAHLNQSDGRALGKTVVSIN
jgi:NADPH2:quinone reductase